MAMDLTGIENYNEYYTNHYFSSIFEENAAETISNWRAASKEGEGARTPWSLLRDFGRLYATVHDRYLRIRSETQAWPMIKDLADSLMEALGYISYTPPPESVAGDMFIPLYYEITKANGAPMLWVLLGHSKDSESGLMQGYAFDGSVFESDTPLIPSITELENEELITKIFFALNEPPRWLILIGINSVALIDRNKWNEKRYLQFTLDEIFSRREESTLQAMAVLLHKKSLCPAEGTSLLDKLSDNSHRHASGVSQDLKYALRESIELLGNEVLYDMAHRRGRNLDADPVDAGQLTLECLRYMYRMLFVLFIEARPELGYAPMKAQVYATSYSLEHLRDVADAARDDVLEVGNGYYLHETLQKLFNLIYDGYPSAEEVLKEANDKKSLHDVFIIEPLKAHIFDPEFTAMLTNAKLRNSVMLKIIDLMSISKAPGNRGRRGRISYSALGINQMGAVYEALLSYRGFIASETLFEVKRKQDSFDELNVGYFVPERELDNYDEDERVRIDQNNPRSALRKHEKGSFIYRLAGREREKSASYYTPEVLTKCLVKYALKELLDGKTADEILSLTVCEPAMGSAAFLNEAVNQLAEAYIDLKQKETGEFVSYEDRQQELQKVKMYIADRNVYGIDFNPTAVELAEVTLWLNTIFSGGFVPWFRTQIVNGNSLIGARRQVYRIEQLETDHSPNRWWENAPVRIEPNGTRMPKRQIYHFLMGDPSMADYTDKVIKSLAPDEIKIIKKWNKEFIKPYDKGDIETLLRISAIIDTLWEKQVALQKEVKKQTFDTLTVFGQPEDAGSSHTTIREKDIIFDKLYKTEGGDNASPYARLKFAMDYWCALWFWPINKADLLPSRSEYLFDIGLILEGGIWSVNLNTGVKPDKNVYPAQLSLFPTERQEMAYGIIDTYVELGIVNLDSLCEKNPRLALVRQIAEQQRFMHWELEFANLFAERGGFDFILGNPPWIKMLWSENDALSDSYPMFAIKKMNVEQIYKLRSIAMQNANIYTSYFTEYVLITGQLNFLNNLNNYPTLIGQQTNLYKCFLPQAIMFSDINGVFAFVHPNSVFDDPNGGILRKQIYPKLKYHFGFVNELLLFPDVGHPSTYSLNIYKKSNNKKLFFYSIANLFNAKAIDECFDYNYIHNEVGIKLINGEWNENGNPNRIVPVDLNTLNLFAQIFDDTMDGLSARIPSLQTKEMLDVLKQFYKDVKKINSLKSDVIDTQLWDETNTQNEGIIIRSVGFTNELYNFIYSGPHIGLSNPLYKSPRRTCVEKADYDIVDLNVINNSYIQRTVYTPNIDISKLSNKIPDTKWGNKYNDNYRVVSRKMLNLKQERTLMSAIIPPKTTHINGLFGLAFNNILNIPIYAGLCSSLPFDFLVKITGKTNLRFDTVSNFPILNETNKLCIEIIVRSLLLNCLTSNYQILWQTCITKIKSILKSINWSKLNSRLHPEHFINFIPEWTWDTPLRTDYERRQALVEIDVLTSMALGMTLEQLKTIYRIQFPVLQSYEADTWYDRNGRIVFTNNRSLTGVGYGRPEWELIKEAQSGTYTRTITDDTQPGGPIERTIVYVAPFDRCDREQDYETAWRFFEEKYGKQI